MFNLKRLVEILDEIVSRNTKEVINNETVQKTYRDIMEILRKWFAAQIIGNMPNFLLAIDCKSGKLSVHFSSEPIFRKPA